MLDLFFKVHDWNSSYIVCIFKIYYFHLSNDIPQVGVLAYSLRTKRYLVQRSNTGLSWRHPQGKSLSNATDYTAANAGDCKDGNRVSGNRLPFNLFF